jgi:catechol 2,3-dioxygenase-like lactoylglutathione lyase family enzyme
MLDHVGLEVGDFERSRAFYKEALAPLGIHLMMEFEGGGGTDNGEPGPRPIYHPGYYGAFVLDPDGNNVEAVCHTATSQG